MACFHCGVGNTGTGDSSDVHNGAAHLLAVGAGKAQQVVDQGDQAGTAFVDTLAQVPFFPITAHGRHAHEVFAQGFDVLQRGAQVMRHGIGEGTEVFERDLQLGCSLPPRAGQVHHCSV
jgi:hypothetical protein